MSERKREIDLRAEVDASEEFTEIYSWIKAPVLRTVDYTIRCGADVECDTHMAVCFAFSNPPAVVEMGVESTSVRECLIDWACEVDEGQELIERLAKRLGLHAHDVEGEIRALLAERLPRAIEDIADEALDAVFPALHHDDFVDALVARLLTMFPELSDEKVHDMLAHRLASGVMTT